MQPQAPSLNSKLRLPCSYGGRIMLFPPSKSLQYVGGETRIVTFPRGISFSTFFVLLSGELLSARSFSIKYRLPDCDLDSLVTVGDNEDLQNMIFEYDSATSRRIRFFLFPLDYPKPTPWSVSVNKLPVQKIPFTSSYSLLPIPALLQTNHPTAKRVDQGKMDATAEETRIQPPLYAGRTRADAGRDSGNETERVEIQDQSGPLFSKSLCSSSDCYRYSSTYVPVWPMQAHTVSGDGNSGKRDLN